MLNSVSAAAYIGLTKQRIHALRDQGRIGLFVGGTWLYSKTELDLYRVTSKGKLGRPKGYKPPPRKPREENEG